jgi:hypothetical protein
MPHVGIKEPAIGLGNSFWFRRREDFDLNQIIKEVFESAQSGLPGRVTCAGRLRMREIEFEERIDVRLGKLSTAGDTLFQQEGVELAAFAEHGSRSVLCVASGLEVSGKAVKVGSQETAPEIDQSAFVFVPIFEHKKSTFWVEKNWGKRNDLFFGSEEQNPGSAMQTLTCFPLRGLKNRCAIKYTAVM